MKQKTHFTDENRRNQFSIRSAPSNNNFSFEIIDHSTTTKTTTTTTLRCHFGSSSLHSELEIKVVRSHPVQPLPFVSSLLGSHVILPLVPWCPTVVGLDIGDIRDSAIAVMFEGMFDLACRVAGACVVFRRDRVGARPCPAWAQPVPECCDAFCADSEV